MSERGKMSFPPEEERFAKNAAVLFDVLGECSQTLAQQGKDSIEESHLMLGKTMVSSLDAHYIIKMFIKNAHPYWDAISAKDENFFLDNAGSVFRFLPANQVNILRDLFLDKTIYDSTAHHKEQVWDIFRAMVRISIKYCQRFPDSEPMSNIDLTHHMKVWKIKS